VSLKAIIKIKVQVLAIALRTWVDEALYKFTISEVAELAWANDTMAIKRPSIARHSKQLYLWASITDILLPQLATLGLLIAHKLFPTVATRQCTGRESNSRPNHYTIELQFSPTRWFSLLFAFTLLADLQEWHVANNKSLYSISNLQMS